MSDVISLFDKRKKLEAGKPHPTIFTHDIMGNLLPPGATDIKAQTAADPNNDGWHIEAKAKCMLCDAEHSVVAPNGVFPMECMTCHHHYMVPIEAPAPRIAWSCRCGNFAFYLTKTFPQCTRCGSFTQDWANS